MCSFLCFSERVNSQSTCRELQGLGKGFSLPFLCLGDLRGEPLRPSRDTRRKEGCVAMCDVLQRIGGGVVVVLGLRLLWGVTVLSQQQKQFSSGPSLAVQWLRLHASTAGDTGSIPGQGTKIPHTAWLKKKRSSSALYAVAFKGAWVQESLGRASSPPCAGDP